MASVRQYPGYPQTVETINSMPLPRTFFPVTFTVTPVGSTVSIATSYQSYSWPDCNYHQANVNLTFTGSAPGISVAEWSWDFGNGLVGTGNSIVHKYLVANIGTIAHLRVTDTSGNRGYASMNLMLIP